MSESKNELSASDYRKLVDAKSTSLYGSSPKKGDPEHDMQCEIVTDFRLDHPDYADLLYAIPNGGKLPYHKDKKGKFTSPQRIKLVKEGLKSGVCDLHLPIARGEWHSLYVECKVLPNQPTDQQRAFMERATREGNYCVVCYTREQAKEIFYNYLRL